MLNRKFMLMAIFLVSLIAISAVSASDFNTTDIATEDNIINDTGSEYLLTDSHEEVMNVTDDGTFTALQEKISNAEEGSTITLENNYFYDDGFKINGIIISKNLTIEGNGHTIDALNKSRIFFITADGIVLNNITFCNGYGKNYNDDINYNGGAVLSHVIDGKNILISNCSFINNSATVAGGAVYDAYSGTVIKNCIFRDNYAPDERGAVDSVSNIVNCNFIDNYGAISYATNVVNCTFVNNSGRAIYYIWNTGLITGIIENCTFRDNSAGAIDTYGGKIVNCSFVNNSAGSGGAILCGSISIFNSDFVNNSAGSGGAIYSSAGISVFESEFVNNSASHGGAIYMESIYQDSGHDLQVYGNSKFANNIADYGGAIYICPADSLIDIDQLGTLSLTDNVTFENNTAFANGSALYLAYIDFYMGYKYNGDNVSFINNHGSVVFLDEILLAKKSYYSYSMENAYFNNNYGSNFGGAISIDEGVISVKFASSYTGKAGGYIGHEEFEFTCIDGMVQVNLNDMNISGGNYRVIVSVDDGDDYHASVGFPVTVESKVSISASDVTKYCGGPEKCIVNLTENGNALANKNINITLNGKTSSVKTDSKGQASVDLDLPVGEYNITTVYDDVSTTSKVTVKSTIATADATGTYLNSKVSTTFLDVDGNALASKQVTFKVADRTYTATTNANGVATANIDLGVGTYTVTALNPVNNEQKDFKLIIGKASSAVSLAAAQSNGVITLTATLVPATATGNVILSINGENRTADIKNGKATLTLGDLNAGNYTVTALYNGDSNLNTSISSTVTFEVDETYSVLTANPVTKTYGTSTKLVVYLKDNKGNAIANEYVKVAIGSAVKNIKTNANGQATLAITNDPGSYTAKITYGTAQTTTKITVKKATPKITAKAKTFKKSVKTKKYTIKLNVHQKVKVAIKVNKKTYYAYTNTKGQATFKITKLTKKGKYTATVSSIANKCYNKAKSVNVKITVK